MTEYLNCPRCNVKTYYLHEDPIMLPRIVKSDTGNGIAVQSNTGLVVRAMICDTCRHIDFTLVLGEEDLASWKSAGS